MRKYENMTIKKSPSGSYFLFSYQHQIPKVLFISTSFTLTQKLLNLVTQRKSLIVTNLPAFMFFSNFFYGRVSLHHFHLYILHKVRLETLLKAFD